MVSTNREIILLGYTKPSHTNWYPWFAFKQAFDELNLKSVWTELEDFTRSPNKTYIFVCWNLPDVYDLIEQGYLTKEDIVLQKVTSMTKRDGDVNWGDDPHSFYKSWHWPAYEMCVDVLNRGYNIYAFGCRTAYHDYPLKQLYVKQLGERLIMIPWTTCMFSYDQLQQQQPVTEGFNYDCAFVGSIWGRPGRGNLESVEDYLMPIVNQSEAHYLGGRGTKNGAVSNEEHISILKQAKLCPIINAASWRVEKGVQDRFWTVFGTGRFGIVDSEGIYDFYNEDEVVCATSAEEYVDKSLYYMKNVDKQLPFIIKAQQRIKQEYNWKTNFYKIFSTIENGQ